MAWKLSGTYFETCSCEVVCPCTASFSLGADYERCKVVLVFNVAEGEIEGTDVGGAKVALVGDTPKVMTDGNWRIGLFVDATDEQAEKLTPLFGGELGGPMAALAPLVGEMLGVERATIDVVEDGLRHGVRIGGAVDFEIEDVVPFGTEDGKPVRLVGVHHPASAELTIARATRSRISAFGVEYDAKAAFSAPFAWAA